MPIIYLADFYAEMRLLRETRFKILQDLQTSDQSVKPYHFKELQKIKTRLESIVKDRGLFSLKTNQEGAIAIELDYELSELQKDEIFLKDGEKGLFKYLQNIHPDFNNEVDKGVKFLENQEFMHFITDRDGTVSNYCGRYQSSIQSIHNAVFLSSLTKKIEGKSIIITSAPLYNIGLKDISIFLEEDFVLAGSKGRELTDEKGLKFEYPIEKYQQEKLNELNNAIENLLSKAEYSSFRYIGSGLQYKFGQTTLARQDKNESIPEDQSLNLKHEIEKLLKKLDPDSSFFRLEDTGKDLEIMLTVDSEDDQGKKDFDKGHGLHFITEQLNMKIENQKLLICGDTSSDLPMLKAANDMGANASSIFVTTDNDLKREVKKLCQDSFIVSSPDVLVTALYLYSKTL